MKGPNVRIKVMFLYFTDKCQVELKLSNFLRRLLPVSIEYQKKCLNPLVRPYEVQLYEVQLYEV